MLPARLAKPQKRATRWRSQAHCSFVRSFACSMCGATAAIEFAHVRLGSGAGMGQRPDDFHGVSLCKDCHQRQHTVGERTFWLGRDVQALIRAFNDASPRAAQIRQVQRERGL